MVTFCRNAPPHGDLEKFWWYYLVDHDLFYVCTKFHSNRPINIEILEGGTMCPPPPPPPPPLGPGRPQNSLGFKGLRTLSRVCFILKIIRLNIAELFPGRNSVWWKYPGWGALDFQLVGVCRWGLKTGPCLKPLGARKIYPVLIYLTKDVQMHTLF